MRLHLEQVLQQFVQHQGQVIGAGHGVLLAGYRFRQPPGLQRGNGAVDIAFHVGSFFIDGCCDLEYPFAQGKKTVLEPIPAPGHLSERSATLWSEVVPLRVYSPERRALTWLKSTSGGAPVWQVCPHKTRGVWNPLAVEAGDPCLAFAGPGAILNP